MGEGAPPPVVYDSSALGRANQPSMFLPVTSQLAKKKKAGVSARDATIKTKIKTKKTARRYE